MNKHLLKLKSAIELLDPTFDWTDFNNYETRKRLQYLTYTLQETGKMLFGYSWELRINGIFCSQLYEDGLTIYNYVKENK